MEFETGQWDRLKEHDFQAEVDKRGKNFWILELEDHIRLMYTFYYHSELLNSI